MKKYDSYKDSGIEWIGEIPSHWEMKKLGSISYMKGRIGWQGLKQAEFTSNPDDPFLITGMNFHDGKIRWDEVYHILEERYNEAPEIQLKESDVLFTKDGTIGKILFVDSIPYPHKASLNSHLLVLRPLKDSYNPRFLFYQLKSLPFKHHIELTKTGTTFYGITQEAMGQYKALVPSPEEQTAIASYLDRKTAEIDELIADKKRLLELYEEEKTAIINQAVTKGVNPDVTMIDSGIEWLGEIPGHWEGKKLKYVSNLRSGNNIVSEQIKESGEYPVYGGNGLRGYFSDYTHDGKHVLIGRQGAYCGNIKYGNGKFWASEHAVVVTSSVRYEVSYLGELLRTMNLGQYSVSAAQPGLAVDFIKNLIIPFPPLKDQQSIVHHIESECKRIDTQVERTRKLIELLTEYRMALISEVVTGKVKVIE